MCREVEPTLWNAAAMLPLPGSMAAGLQRLKLSALRYRSPGDSHHHIHQLAGHDDHLAHRLVADEAAHALVRQRPLAKLRLVGGGGDVDLAAQFAVDLQHQL